MSTMSKKIKTLESRNITARTLQTTLYATKCNDSCMRGNRKCAYESRCAIIKNAVITSKP